MGFVEYSRWRFSTALPAECRYTDSHCWIRREGPGVWRAGLTAFALWILGDVVEYGFTPASGTAVEAGQAIGWVEGLKSVQTVESAFAGVFLGESVALHADITLLQKDPYGEGWLYRVRGAPAPDSLSAGDYATLLDAAVDAVRLARAAECGDDCNA